MKDVDFLNLPVKTCKFVNRLSELGLDRNKIYGLFVMLGIYVGAPNTKEKLEENFRHLNEILPIDRSRNIDEVVGHLYAGYDHELNEFCFRSGADFKFREIKIPDVDKAFSIITLKDEGLLQTSVTSVEKLADSTHLYDAFLLALGASSVKGEATLLEAFTCGIFQIQLLATSDISGARQIAEVIRTFLPLVYARCFKTLLEGQIDYFVTLNDTQVALLELMLPMDQGYAQQMWGFQSHLFFQEGESITGLEELTAAEWHSWVLDKAKVIDAAYPGQLKPLSQSDISLSGAPIWGSSVGEFDACDAFIDEVWGYSANSLATHVEVQEYRALMVHVIYSSLTSSRETLH